MSRFKCTYIEKTNKHQIYLRRYSSDSKCSGEMGIHDAKIAIGVEEESTGTSFGEISKTDERYPKKCDSCDYHFTDEDTYQVFKDRIYLDQENNIEVPLRDAPIGAMYYADWYNDLYVGPDGRCLVVILPNRDPWIIDSEASNCTRKGDLSHKCWVRHGTPPNVNVDKNGNTCSAGAGSILSGNYHGFLRNGYLED